MPTVLVVDDSPTIRKMVIAALRPLNATVIEANNGLEAIEQLGVARFDLITLDLNMPDMHGLEVVAFVRNQPLFAALPILVVTTQDDAQQQCSELGATAFLRKPFTPNELCEAASQLLAATA